MSVFCSSYFSHYLFLSVHKIVCHIHVLRDALPFVQSNHFWLFTALSFTNNVSKMTSLILHYYYHILLMQMAKAVLEAYPALPVMSFGTSKREMASERTKFALALLSDSGKSLFSVL